MGKLGAPLSLLVSGGTLKTSLEMIADYLEICIF